MQIDVITGDKYDARESKDDPNTSFDIWYTASTGRWDVNCWKKQEGSNEEIGHWHQSFYDNHVYTLPTTGEKVSAEVRAIFEFERFR